MSIKTWSCGVGFALLLFLVFTAGCASNSVRQRGWIGGEYGLTSTLPKGVKENKAGLLVIALASNTPAQSAGCREGDLILEIGGKPVTTFEKFRLLVDSTEPGKTLPLRIWREGKVYESSVTVGCETYRRGGNFAVTMLPIVKDIDLWPDPDFSLVLLGYRETGKRTELGSVEEVYRRNCKPDPKVYHTDWRAWLGLLDLSRGTVVISQQSAP